MAATALCLVGVVGSARAQDVPADAAPEVPPSTGPVVQDISPPGTELGQVPPEAVTRRFGDGLDAQVPWVNPDLDPRVPPEGLLHVGAEIGAGLRVLASASDPLDVGYASVGFLLVLRLDRLVGIRVVPTARFSSTAAYVYPSSRDLSPESQRFAAFFVGTRALVSFELERYVAVLLGGIVGADVFDDTGFAEVRGGPELGLGFRLTDDRRLELSALVRYEHCARQITEHFATPDAHAYEAFGGGMIGELTMGYTFP